MRPTVSVTGDVVLDCHLYGGVKTAATSFSEPGSVYQQGIGGAALTCRLLQAAADASGATWDAAKAKWEAGNKARQADGDAPLPWPRKLADVRPSPSFDARLAFETAGLDTSLPQHLRSYGVWTARPAGNLAKKRVWRVEQHFGYGPTGDIGPDVFRPASLDRSTSVDLTVIDDGAILFRHERFRPFWPDRSSTGGFFLLKMASPLCRGDLWPELTPVSSRLIVVVSANDIRREDLQISRRLSWEQSAEDALAALRRDPIGQELLRAAHVIVNFGSEGALWLSEGGKQARLLFDPLRLEGEHGRDFEGSVYGFQTCLAAGVASHLVHGIAQAGASKANTIPSVPALDDLTGALQAGIAAGLAARRALLAQGHGVVGAGDPGFPSEALGIIAAGAHGGFVCVDVGNVKSQSTGAWAILTHDELGHSDPTPLVGLGELTARYGVNKALSHVPALRRGRLFTVDRGEIESLRVLDGLIRAYEDVNVQKKPLSIGVFGPPGAGKSFGVKALVEGVLGPKAPFLEFNLSQFKDPSDLIGALHRVRDAVLGGVTPVAFWDEFDSKNYGWLQYLLAPMQDGAFQEGQVTHPIGKSIFVFAGGTSPTFEQFGVAEPKPASANDEEELSTEDREDRKAQSDRFREYKLLKGPDFVSRLHGFLNVLGPNPSSAADLSYPIRRATLLRALLGLGEDQELSIDGGLLHALLNVRKYHYGARSFEKIVGALAQARDSGRLSRSGLPPDLSRDTDVADLRRLLDERSAFKSHPDMEALAAAVHAGFLEGAQRSALQAAILNEPHAAWTIHPAVERAYESLPEDLKASNRAAARRIPDHLALVNFVVVPQVPGEDPSWRLPLEAVIERHLDRLAQAEHLGWWAEREAGGWTVGERDNLLKRHPALVPWAELSRSNQDKDRASARGIPSVLEVAKYKAVPVATV